MKAYILGVKDDPDQGNLIVFANNATEAKKQSGDLVYDSWIDLQAHRYKVYDGMENLKDSDMALMQWHNGWRWFDNPEAPDDDGENSDEVFLGWWHKTFDKTCAECKVTNEFVQYRYCGYDNKVSGRYRHELVCNDCENQHLQDI